jgi:hypothetical protein
MIQVAIMLVIGAAAGAASFTHVHDVAAAHGQPGWLAWADAVVLELMSVASGLELRRRKRLHIPLIFPAVVLGVAVALSLSAQVVEAERSPIGWTAAAIPALGFLVMVKIALAHAPVPSPQAEPSPPGVQEPPQQPAPQRASAPVVAIDDAALLRALKEECGADSQPSDRAFHPDLGRRRCRRRRRAVPTVERGSDGPGAPSRRGSSALLAWAASRGERAELERRQLYVAITRARDSLWVGLREAPR